MRDFILELCTDCIQSVTAACHGGANRIELCSNIIIGGTTPSFFLFEEVKHTTDIPVHILIRPRFGDFCYSESEVSIMCREIERFRLLGAQGVVIGALNPDGTLDVKTLRRLLQKAEGMSVTLHRAFDVCRNPFEAMEQAISLGFHTILTSGQQNSCQAGIPLLSQLAEKNQGRIELLAGSGINAHVIPQIYRETGICSYHMTGKHIVQSPMTFRNKQVNMGLPSIPEFEIYRTDPEAVRQARLVLENL